MWQRPFPLSLQTAPDGWKNSVRHNLSLNKCFEKVENKTSSSSRKGCLWALNPAKIDKMEEEMQKWKRKDLPAIRRSMANPGENFIFLNVQGLILSRQARQPDMFLLILIICLLPCRWVGQTDYRPPRELQTQDYGAGFDTAAQLSNWPPAAGPSSDAAPAYSHPLPAVFTDAPAPPASGPAPGSGPSGPNVPCSGSDTPPSHSPWPFPQSPHPAGQQATRRLLQCAQWYAHRGGRTGSQHHGLCPSRYTEFLKCFFVSVCYGR